MSCRVTHGHMKLAVIALARADLGVAAVLSLTSYQAFRRLGDAIDQIIKPFGGWEMRSNQIIKPFGGWEMRSNQIIKPFGGWEMRSIKSLLWSERKGRAWSAGTETGGRKGGQRAGLRDCIARTWAGQRTRLFEHRHLHRPVGASCLAHAICAARIIISQMGSATSISHSPTLVCAFCVNTSCSGTTSLRTDMSSNCTALKDLRRIHSVDELVEYLIGYSCHCRMFKCLLLRMINTARFSESSHMGASKSAIA
eukprot:6214470-Pleurochrysis_carterae.AAC.4